MFKDLSTDAKPSALFQDDRFVGSCVVVSKGGAYYCEKHDRSDEVYHSDASRVNLNFGVFFTTNFHGKDESWTGFDDTEPGIYRR